MKSIETKSEIDAGDDETDQKLYAGISKRVFGNWEWVWNSMRFTLH